MNNENEIRHNYLNLFIIQVGATTSLVIVMVGFVLAREYGIITAISSIIIGNVVLALLSVPIVIDSVKTRQTSVQRVFNVLGESGAKLSAYALFIVLIGWFAINLTLISSAVQNLVGIKGGLLEKAIINITIGGIIVFTVMKGINKIRAFSKYSILLLITSISFTFMELIPHRILQETTTANLIVPEAIFMVIASLFALLFDLPTYYRFSSSTKDGLISVILTMVVVSLVEFTGVLFACVTNAPDITEVFINVTTAFVVALNLAFIVIDGCSINNNNLYICATNLSVVTRISTNKLAILGGSLSILLSFLNLLDFFYMFLNIIMILIAAITIIMVRDSLFSIKDSSNIIINTSICFGCIIGILSISGIIRVYNCAFIEAAISTLLIHEFLTLLRFAKKRFSCIQDL